MSSIKKINLFVFVKSERQIGRSRRPRYERQERQIILKRTVFKGGSAQSTCPDASTVCEIKISALFKLIICAFN